MAKWFENYLSAIVWSGGGPQELEEHKGIVEQKLDLYRANPTIWSKYAWVAAYHNYCCESFDLYFLRNFNTNSKRFRIEVEKFRAPPSEIIERKKRSREAQKDQK